MKRIILRLTSLVATAAALFPAISEAGVRLPNHNETLVRDPR